MARIESKALSPYIVEVLSHAAVGKGSDRGFLTAYQVLSRLPKDIQDDLRHEYGETSGQGSGTGFSPATRVAQVAAQIQGVEQQYLDTADLKFDVKQVQNVNAGYQLCALFRLAP